MFAARGTFALPTPHRFLGFGFAAADLLVEIKADGCVSFALGAGEAVLGAKDQSLSGKPWQSLFHPEDHPMVEAVFRGLGDGTRAGPVVLGVASPSGAPPRYASLTAIRLPQNKGAISCALSRASSRGASGLQTREQFESRATELLAGSTEALELAFIEFNGLSQCKTTQDPAALEALVAGALRAQAYQGEAATPVGPDRYALVRGSDEPTEAMTGRLARVLTDAGVEGVTTGAASMPLSGVERPKQVAQALRYALNMVLENGLSRALPGDLSDALDRAMRATLSKAGQLGAAIRHRRFTLAYQPVVSLRDGSLHHHEVLVRFGSEGSPFPTIRMAEEMDLIEPLDLAILDETMLALQRDPALKLAVNVSGRSLTSESYLTGVMRMLRERPWARGRLMFELTESAAVEDLVVADRHIQALRTGGCEVCLDDFGAGAASLAYLQQLTLDVLKIDGRYIRDLQHGGREATFVKHLVNMCSELNVRTLAEMVETPEAEDAVRRAGVDYAQGWLYGRARETPADDTGVAARGRARTGALAIRSALDR
ncbi:MAG: EAL domain-containing protein [Alphaproteobacteria bacterium]|nr:EAL domain-containing protein [Alphaproteobacteria bacterium]MBU1515809.1 EAL domain-containing protein [Alphaproteobacteria bacterium]MBU2094031.1 EAL domain-containing protein [Alphaproteobacteria bacterium]MBU2152630.1 EAL domain-containing protein [Alphaproteobacteria bacterium]MBU2308823.1 EAL domain-containing protein [Alphaproteobacteria bacterium]